MSSSRNSYSSYEGNTRNIPGIRSSRTGTRGNQIRFQLLRRRLTPGRQLVLPEPAPVRSLFMEVKDVFS